MMNSALHGAMDAARPVWRVLRRAAELAVTTLLFLVFGVGLTAECGWLLGLSDSELQKFGPIKSCQAGVPVRDALPRYALLAIFGIGLSVTLWGAWEIRAWLRSMRRQ
jgi:hypothetical protein